MYTKEPSSFLLYKPFIYVFISFSIILCSCKAWLLCLDNLKMLYSAICACAQRSPLAFYYTNSLFTFLFHFRSFYVLAKLDCCVLIIYYTPESWKINSCRIKFNILDTEMLTKPLFTYGLYRIFKVSKHLIGKRLLYMKFWISQRSSEKFRQS